MCMFLLVILFCPVYHFASPCVTQCCANPCEAMISPSWRQHSPDDGPHCKRCLVIELTLDRVEMPSGRQVLGQLSYLNKLYGAWWRHQARWRTEVSPQWSPLQQTPHDHPLMLGQRLRRWPSIKPEVGGHVVFAETAQATWHNINQL